MEFVFEARVVIKNRAGRVLFEMDMDDVVDLYNNEYADPAEDAHIEKAGLVKLAALAMERRLEKFLEEVREEVINDAYHLYTNI